MNKWKDTARTSKEIVKSYASGEKVVIPENTLVIIEKELPGGLVLILDTNPEKVERRHHKLKTSEVIVEDYSVTKEINVPILLSDGWDAQDLLR